MKEFGLQVAILSHLDVHKQQEHMEWNLSAPMPRTQE
uniref:Uncharacterized protein n=1 Tax=Arundo donax TaxID=35708 RepID=A0A0A9B7V3_ARUDO